MSEPSLLMDPDTKSILFRSIAEINIGRNRVTQPLKPIVSAKNTITNTIASPVFTTKMSAFNT